MCNITTTCIIFIFFLLWLIHQFFSCCYWAALIWNIFYLGQICVLQILFLNVVQFLLIIFSVKSTLYKNGDLKKKIIYIVEQEKTILNQSYQKLKEKKTVLDTKWWGLVFFLRLAFQLRCLETPLIVIQAGTTVVYPHVNNT